MLRDALFGAIIASWLLISGAAQAQDEAHTKEPISGFEAGLQLGNAVPIGDAAQHVPVSKIVTGSLPVIVDAGYRINDRVYAGVYFQYAPAKLADDACARGADCSASVLRYGLAAQYHFNPRETWDPWAGVGAGLENLGVDRSISGQDAESNITGFEFLNLTGGADYRINDQVGFGPFVTLTVAQYSESVVRVDSKKVSYIIDDKTIHEWLIVGVRARFNP